MNDLYSATPDSCRLLALYYDDPIEITHGEGRHVWDFNGRRYLDFFGGILTTMTAHALPEVTKAVSEQAGRIIHSSTLYLNRPMVELAERIAQVSGIPDARVFFTTSGTEANDTALLLATAHRRSNTILAMRNSYHGRSFSAVGITGNRGWSPTSLSPLQTLYVHGGVRTRGPFAGLDDRDFIDACVADLKDVLGHTRPPAALIAEPVQGVGGFTSPPDGLYAAFRDVLKAQGILWIADEVQTGWGRTATTSGAGRRTPAAARRTSSPSPRASATACPSARHRPRRDHELPGRQQHLHLRRHPDHHGRRARQPRLPARTRPPGQRPARRRPAHRAPAGGHRPAPRGTGGARPRTDDRRRAGQARHRRGRPADRRAAVLEAARQGGLLIGKGGGHDTSALRIAPPLSLTVAEAEEGAAILEEALRSSY
ncbi:hypothetical protein GCM10017687_80490 [Streptomyces echinatus]